MAVLDDFGRVTKLTEDLKSLSDSLKASVGKAVEYATEQAKGSTEKMKEEFDRLVEAMEELGDDVKESLKSTKGFVEEVKRAAESVEKIKAQRASSEKDTLADAQREQTRILQQILSSQRKALSDKAAKFTSGSTVLSAPAPKKTGLKEMGFRPKGADKIPAMVSPNEFIVSKRGTIGNEGILDRINRGYVRGGKVKPAYLAEGSYGGKRYQTTDLEGSVRVVVEGKYDRQWLEDFKAHAARAGKEVSVEFSDSFDTELRKSAAKWFAGMATAFTGGGDPWQNLFEGAVKDVTEFRREMRNLAFQTEGITGNFREAQAEFAKIGENIAGRTGVNVTAFQKAYMNNARKGFKDQKAGMKVLESGLKLSTLIGSESQSTANLFADMHRELGLGAVQMERMANNMQMVARSTGVTGDELIAVMKSSDKILKNLRNQGTLTTTAARNITQALAEFKKQGFDEEGQKIIGAMSGYSAFQAADGGTQSLLGIAAGEGRVNYLDLMHGDVLQDGDKMGKMAGGLKDYLASIADVSPENFDFEMLTTQQRRDLSMVLEKFGSSLGEAEATLKTLDKSASGLGGQLSDLDKIAKSSTATEKQRQEAEKKMNDALLSSSMDMLGSVTQATEKFGDKSLGEVSDILGGDNKFGRDFQTGAKDMADMLPYLSDSIKSQFGLSGTAEQMSQQMAKMGTGGQVELRSLAAAEQLDKALASQGKDAQNFSKRMQAALARGDTAGFKTIAAEMSTAFQESQVAEATSVDPMERLEQTMTELNETIRNSFSPLVGGVLDLIGVMGLLGMQVGLMGSTIFNLIGGDFLKFLKPGNLREAMQKAFTSVKGMEFFKPFSKGFDRAVAGGSTTSQALIRGFTGQFQSFVHGPMGRMFQKALGPAVLLLGGIKGAMEADKAGRTKTEGFILGALTGGAHTGSFLSSTLGVQKGSATDKTLGVAGAAAWGAAAGAAISVSLGGLDFGTSILIGAIIGGVSEIIKIITEGTDILQNILAPFQVVVDYIYYTFKNIYDVVAGILTLDFGRVFGAIFNQIGSTIALIPRLVLGVIQSIFIGIPKLVLRALSMLWELPRMMMESIKGALAGLANNSWFGPIFKTLSVAFNAIYDGFMAIWTPISQIFSGLFRVFSDIGKALFGASEGGGILAGIMWVLQKAVWGVSYVISWLLSPIILLAKALGFVLKIVGKLIQGIIYPFQYLYETLVGHSIVPDLVFGIIKFFAMLPIRIMKFLAMIPIHLAKALLNLHVIIGSAIMSIGSAIMAGFKAVFVDLPNYLWSGLTSLASSDWFGPIFEPLMWVLSPLKDAMSALYDSFAEVGSAFAEVGAVFGELYNVAFEVLNSLYDAVSSVFSSIYAIFSPIASIFVGTGDAAAKTFGFMDMLKGAVWGLSKAIGFVLKVALFPLKLILEGLAFVIKVVANVIKGFADIIAGVFTLDGSRIWEGVSAIGSAIWSVFAAIPKMLFNLFKKLPRFGLKALYKVFIEFPSWLFGKLKDTLLGLPGLLLDGMSAVIFKLPVYLWDGFKWAFGKLWDWIKSWVPESVRNAAAAVGEGYSATAEEQYGQWGTEGPSSGRSIGAVAGGVADMLEGDFGQGLKKMAYGAGEFVHAQAQNAWDATKYAASFLNPFSYFKEGTKKIEKPGLGMLHEGEMVVPANIVDKLAAMGSGAFGSLSAFLGGKKKESADGGGSLASLISFIKGKTGGDQGFVGSLMSSLSDKIEGMKDSFAGCCPGADGRELGLSGSIDEEAGQSFFGKIKSSFEDAQGYTDKFFKPLTLGFKRARKNGDGFFASVTNGLKYQFMSMSHGNEGGVMGRLAGSMDWLNRSIFGQQEGKDTKKGILQRLKDGIFGSKEGEETKKGILEVIKNGLFGEGGEGMKKGIFNVMKEGFFGKEGEGGGLMGWFKSKVFGHKVGEGEEGPSKPGLADAAKGTAKSLWESTKRRLEINTEDGMINGAKNAAKKMYGKAKDRIFGEKLAEGQMGPAKPGLLTRAKSKLSGMYGSAKKKLFGAGPEKGLESATAAVESAASAESKAPGKLETFKEKMKNIAEGIKEFSGTKVLAGALNLIPSSIGLTAMIPGSFGARQMEKIDGERLKTSLSGLANGLKEMGSLSVTTGSLNLIPASLGLVAMIPGSVGAKMIQQIDGDRLQKSLRGLARGISEMASAKVLLGSLVMGLVGIASLGLLPAIPVLVILGALGKLIEFGLSALGKGLGALGQAAANPYTWLGVALLGALSLVMIPLAYAISLLAPAMEAFAKIITATFDGMAGLIRAVGESIAMLLKEVSPSKAVGLFILAGALAALGVGMAAFAGGGFIASWIDYFSGDGLMNKIMALGAMGPNLMMASQGISTLGKAFKSFAANKSGGWAEWFAGSDGVIEGFKELSKIGTPEFVATAEAVHKMGEGMEKIHAIPMARPMPGDATTATTPAETSVAPSNGVPAVEPVHLRDITGTILRDRAGSGGNKMQSDELSRMEEASYRQVEELEQIRQGIQELVSLMKPKGGGVAGSSDPMSPSNTRDPRRPMHAARFGKMKFGVPGGLANRNVVNTGEV